MAADAVSDQNKTLPTSVESTVLMEFELWYLVAVPLLFAAGWYLRGYDAKQRRKETENLPDNYFRGLSLLLSNEPDKAIDAFIEVVKIDPETIELHHALGNLFCKRGEFDRAIRIHTHLINRADLPDEDRLRALSELANDYLKAGIYDKAIECFERLSKNGAYRLDARRSLLRIRCTEHDWNGAIEVARRLEKEAAEDHGTDISHFHCELAAAAARAKNAAEAEREVNLALLEQPNSPRALMLAGDFALAAGDARRAVESWEALRKHSPDHFPLVVRRLVKGYEALGDEEGAERTIRAAMAECPTSEVVEEAMKRAFRKGGEKEAGAIVGQAMKSHPTLGNLSVAMELRQLVAPDDPQLQGIAGMLKKESDRQGRYQCRKCGFLSHSYLWQCPGCGGWDTYPTLRVQDMSVRKKG